MTTATRIKDTSTLELTGLLCDLAADIANMATNYESKRSIARLIRNDLIEEIATELNRRKTSIAASNAVAAMNAKTAGYVYTHTNDEGYACYDEA